jgi:hypothetical protein
MFSNLRQTGQCVTAPEMGSAVVEALPLGKSHGNSLRQEAVDNRGINDLSAKLTLE